MRQSIRFKFAADKALAAIHWMVVQRPGLDLHTMMKTCYFADRQLLNANGRPIFGATYRAMRFGPVPLEIYEMAKGEAYWLAELGLPRFPWTLEGYHLISNSNEAPNLSVLSQDDFQVLATSFAVAEEMDFNARTAATHGRDWQAANLGVMRYEDMLDDTPDKAERAAELAESAPYLRL
jgi:hypothetical protein